MDIERLTGNPRTVSITKVVSENDSDRTIFFEDSSMSPTPGQFLMVWLPRVDEIPLSISYLRDGIVGLTIRPVGHATEALAALSLGDLIGIRGPFGHPFHLDSKRPLLVGGGIGMAPLRTLVHQFVDLDLEIAVITGARTKGELLFVNELRSLENDGVSLTVTTDDGSEGVRGFVTSVVEQVMAETTPDTIYTCGPEPMMHSLWHVAQSHGIRFQASLERYMKCGCGICGSCALDPSGDLVCVDGPVFSGKQLSKISEFGSYHRDSTGVKKTF